MVHDLRTSFSNTQPLVCVAYLAAQRASSASNATDDVDCHRGLVILQQLVFHYIRLQHQTAGTPGVDRNMAQTICSKQIDRIIDRYTGHHFYRTDGNHVFNVFEHLSLV